MKNPTTHYGEMNEFTQMVKTLNGYKLIRLRNGDLVRPLFKEAEDENCRDCFATEDWRYCWNVDGRSFTRPDYDMMEIVYE